MKFQNLDKSKKLMNVNIKYNINKIFYTIFPFFKFKLFSFYDDIENIISHIVDDILSYAYADKLKEIVLLSNNYTLTDDIINLFEELKSNVVILTNNKIDDEFLLMFCILKNNIIPFYLLYNKKDDIFLMNKHLYQEEANTILKIKKEWEKLTTQPNKKVKKLFNSYWVKKREDS